MIRQRHPNYHPITVVIAIAVALSMCLAPLAWADPPPLAGAEAAIAAGHSGGRVQPNPDQQPVKRGLAEAGPCSEVCSGGGSGSLPATTVRVVAPDHGFVWADAGIGAGAALILAGIGLAGRRAATMSGSRPTRHPRSRRRLMPIPTDSDGR